MKKGKRVKPKFPIEYRVLITPQYHEREKETFTLIALRTVSEFTNFRYEIVVHPSIEDHTIRLNIQGLRAPQVSLPESGPAVFETEYNNLSGQYDVIISKLGREENVFSISISDAQVIVEKSPRKKFVEVVTTRDEW